MKKKSLLIFPLAITALMGCSVPAANYHTVSVYSDYDGMEEDLEKYGHYDSSKATFIGICYALAGKKANSDAIKANDAKANYRVAQRKAPHGYKYVFNTLAGNYDNGDAVNLDAVTADCNVFATFDLDTKDYTVKVQPIYGNYLFDENVAYGSTFGSIPALKELLLSKPVHDPEFNPNDETTRRDIYYIDYTFDKWEMSVYDEDDKLISTSDFDVSTIDTAKVTDKTIFKPIYLEENKEYDVKVNYQLRTLEDDGTGELHYVYGALPGAESETVKVPYGTALAKKDFEGYKYVSAGKNGEPERYLYSDALPIALRVMAKDDKGGYIYIGGVIDISYIAFNCEITLVYEAKTATHQVKFHNDAADKDHVTDVSVIDGATAKAPSLLNVPADKSFYAWGTLVDEVYTVASLDDVTADMELYPILVNKEVVNEKGLTFTFDYDLAGYVLTNVPGAIGKVDATALASTFEMGLSFVGVDSFGEALHTITEIDLPSTVISFTHGAFNDLYLVETIKLVNTRISTIFAGTFRNLSRLESVTLPMTLTDVGSKAFANCISLTSIYIDMTKEETESTSLNFADDWANGYPVNYKT